VRLPIVAQPPSEDANTAEREAVVVARDIHKRYGQGEAAVWALRGCDLVLWRGRIVALMGPSGSGKSTLLHIVSGLDRPTQGQVEIEGRDLSRVTEREMAGYRARKIGFVLQRDNLIPALNLEENVAAPLLIGGLGAAKARARGREMLERVGLSRHARAWPGEVSGGEAQRAAVARACAGRPALIVADEPTGALDKAAGANVLDLLRELAAATGAATLLVTHDPTVAGIADEVLLLVDGRIQEKAQ
jgi:ABC-type lipoprotein export system ATPase subunit